MKYVGMFFVFILVAFTIGFHFGRDQRSLRSTETVPLTAEERSSKVILKQSIPATALIVQFVDRGTFSEMVKKLPDGDKTYAFTGYDHEGDCVVTMKADTKIDFVPSEGWADWDDSYDGLTLAHEILHCIRGDWHPAWKEILKHPPSNFKYVVKRTPYSAGAIDFKTITQGTSGTFISSCDENRCQVAPAGSPEYEKILKQIPKEK